jgi:O-antigen ligase
LSAEETQAAAAGMRDAASAPDAARTGWATRAAGALAFVGLALYAIAAPHSIAGAWIGLSVATSGWFARILLTGRLGLRRTPLDLPLWLLAGWTLLSCLFSPEPGESIPKLANVATFLVFYLAQSVLTRARAITLAALMIASGVAGVLWGAGELLAGRGVVIVTLAADSPLKGASPLAAGDAVWRVNRRRVSSVEEIDEVIRSARVGERLSVSVISRGEHVEWTGGMVTAEAQTSASPAGLTGGGRTRRFRASGWTRHYETFAETIRMIAHLSLGFALAYGLRKRREGGWRQSGAHDAFWLAAISCGLLAIGVALTAMRTSLAAFAVGAFVAAWRAATGRRARVAVVGLVIAVLTLGALVVWRTRAGGALRLQDPSATRRFEVARVAVERVPQRPLLGHGMDSVQQRWHEWGFPGDDLLHTHSTPIQLAFERGLPALFFWLWLMLAFWRMTTRAERAWRDTPDAATHGLALGACAALAGFLASSLVNYNFGDAEVALLLWWMMGAVLTIEGSTAIEGRTAERGARG